MRNENSVRIENEICESENGEESENGQAVKIKKNKSDGSGS